jgi:hypothetical protein
MNPAGGGQALIAVKRGGLSATERDLRRARCREPMRF